jgi:transposase
MSMDKELDILTKKFQKMMIRLNERQLRQYLATEAEAIGYGGVARVVRASGVSRKTIEVGMKEINSNEDIGKKVRRRGGGRKKEKEKHPEIIEKVLKEVDPKTYGNPENPLSYTTKSLRKIGKTLKGMGVNIGYNIIADILKENKYSLQQNQKMLQVGEAHIDRNEQFEFINNKAKEFLELKEPVISIDAKKKENVGNFKNNGQTYNKKNDPTQVLDHDFPLEELGKVTPYGVYDVNKNEGFVNLGISKDTAEFAVESISRWWLTVGKNTYATTSKIYINCDGGGSNGSSNRLFKQQLQEFANQSGLDVHISHFPPGTSKWNKIEHRLFCYISSNWRGQPLVDIKTIINLIGSTTTTKGLKVVCVKDDNKYEIGKKVSDEDFAKINLKCETKFPKWNYIISPNK